MTVAIGACAGNPGVPRYWKTHPAPLTPVGPPRRTEDVRIAMKELPWWTVSDGGTQRFILGFDETAAGTLPGRVVGPVRSRNVALTEEVFVAMRCGWQIAMGTPDGCPMSREQGQTLAREAITEARAELRAKAGDAGATGVRDVRCFAEARPSDAGEPGHLDRQVWCEGTAVVTESLSNLAADADPGAAAAVDPAAPVEQPVTMATRFALVADGSVAMLGEKPVVGSTLGLRYRPLELGFYILDLQRTSIAPKEGGLVGLGITALARFAIKGSRADALVGGSALAAAQNGATNPDFDGLYNGFVGIAYQSPWRIQGVAQPFVQLRAGAAYGTALAQKAMPMVELHLGLSTPERR